MAERFNSLVARFFAWLRVRYEQTFIDERGAEAILDREVDRG